MLENIGIFDSHAHYEDKKFDEDRDGAFSFNVLIWCEKNS